MTMNASETLPVFTSTSRRACSAIRVGPPLASAAAEGRDAPLIAAKSRVVRNKVFNRII